MNQKKKPDPIDVHVGSRIRLRRNMLRLSQEKLGEKLGVTFQQVQKYEKGANRVGASRLQAMSEVMGVHVSYFFEEAPSNPEAKLYDSSDIDYIKFCSSSEGVQLMRAFAKIADTKVRRKILDLAKALAAEQEIS